MKTIACAILLSFALSTSRVPDVDHFPTIEKAMEAAKKDKKSILVDFTGSDWCKWCIQLNKEVFDSDEWKKNASSKYVFVELDYPKSKKLDPEQGRYNGKMKALYAPPGFPSIFVLDSEGRAYAKTGYMAGGPEAYLEHLEGFASRKDELAVLTAKTKTGDNGARLEANRELVAKLKEYKVDASWLEPKETFVDLDPKSDESKGYLKDLALTFSRFGNAEKAKKYMKLLRDADPAKADRVETQLSIEKDVQPLADAQDWKGALAKLAPMTNKKGEAGQLVHYWAGLMELKNNNKPNATKNFEAALALAPESDMVATLKKMIEASKK